MPSGCSTRSRWSASTTSRSADVVEPGVTVVAQDPAALGRAAAELLFARLDGFEEPSRRVVVPTRLVVRGSGELRAGLTGSAPVVAIVCHLRFASRMAVRRSLAPTLADVAAEAGVSQATASRALAGSPLVNAQTRRRVWEVAERLHFQPNRLARSLRRGATMAVGLRRARRRDDVLRDRAEGRAGRRGGRRLPRARGQHRARRAPSEHEALRACARTRSTA